MHRKTEPFKQELRVAKDFSEDSCIACLDSWGYGFVDPKNIKLFFKQNHSKISDEDVMALVRRFDIDGDMKMTHDEFLAGIEPQEPYAKVIVKD